MLVCYSILGKKKKYSRYRGWGIRGMVLNTVVRKASVRKRDI